MKLAIRAANASDEPQIREVIRHAYADRAERLPDLPDVSEGLIGEIEDGRMHVAEISGAIVGVLNVAARGDALHVMNIAVDPRHSGKGIGKTLLEYAEALAISAGRARLALATHKDMGGNVSLYEHLGWDITETKGNKILMQRKLGQD